MLAFVTVGTFQFDLLVQTVLSDAVLVALRDRGYTSLVVQCGNSHFDLASAVAAGQTVTLDRHDVRVELWKSKGTLEADYRRADLVIGHAGAGTILEVLRLRKPLIVVPNPTLLHNHQLELARALGQYLTTSSVDDLADTVIAFDPDAMREFPLFDGSRFRALVDDEMGF
ncbi:glycosyltransferase family 1 protein [Mycena filopes]|nr:glycosyltransferase family 1 protein [Mycena filopes]